MQRTLAQSLVQEDPTCCGAAKPVHLSAWAHGLQLLKPARPGAGALQQEKPMQWEAHVPSYRVALHSQQPEKAQDSSKEPVQPKTKKTKKKNLSSGDCIGPG